MFCQKLIDEFCDISKSIISIGLLQNKTYNHEDAKLAAQFANEILIVILKL